MIFNGTMEFYDLQTKAQLHKTITLGQAKTN